MVQYALSVCGTHCVQRRFPWVTCVVLLHHIDKLPVSVASHVQLRRLKDIVGIYTVHMITACDGVFFVFSYPTWGISVV